MRILMLSWRDIKNPLKGGAEIYTYEVLKRLVNEGHKVSWFAAAWPNCSKKKEIIDGIKIIRGGSFFTVYWHAYKYYKKDFKGKFDLVIDQVNTIPFFTPLFVKEKKCALIYQLAREIWFSETSFPINLLGYLSEPIYLRLYKKQKAITISQSTMKDLNGLGIKNVEIVPVGLSVKPIGKLVKKQKELTLIYVGRLKKSKGVHHIIKALKLINEKQKAKLWIIGYGDYERKLKKLVKDLNLTKKVIFYGYIDTKKKESLMSKAHFICAASKREGWGMIITEANALGTPAIVYNSPGLRDAVKNGLNGFISKKNKPEELSMLVVKAYSNKGSYLKLCKNSLQYAKNFSWDKTARLFEKVIKKIKHKAYN